MRKNGHEPQPMVVAPFSHLLTCSSAEYITSGLYIVEKLSELA